ncbi:MAG: acetyl-CoA synthetase [Chloroflexi bacterium]|nr:acetyl-CoA synthetase [Chloroflexota bacterium]
MNMKMNLDKQLSYLFNPKSVAVIGASNTFGKWGFNLMGRVLQSKGNREVYPVNRKDPEVMGLKAYKNLLDVPGTVDFAVITVPYGDVPATMQDCVQKGVKAAVVITGGLAESGEEGARVEREVVEIARRGKIRFVGPNCLGHFDAHSGFYTVAFMPKIQKGNVALISQSGNSSQSILNYGVQNGLGFSKFVSSGNEADLRFEDYLEYLGSDDKTDIILGYVEGFREGKRLLQLCKEITRKKPVVIMKAGRTDVGARAARSHSAALAGSDVVLDAALRQCGVIRVNEINELVEVAVALLGQPLPRGRRVGVLAMGGGMAVMAADAVRHEGLELPPLSSSTMEKLDALLSRRWPHANPVDPAGDFLSYHLLWPMIEDENFDSIIIIGGVGMTSSFAGWAGIPPSMKYDAERLRKGMERAEIDYLNQTIELMRMHRKPVIFTTMVWGAVRRGSIFRKLKQNYLEPYHAPEKSAQVLAHLVRYSEYLGTAEST